MSLSRAWNIKSNPSRSSYGRGHLVLGLFAFSLLGACGDSSTGGKANTDGSLDGWAANSDTTSRDESGPTDVGPDSVAVLPDVPPLDSAADRPGPLLDTGSTDISQSDAPPALDGATKSDPEVGKPDTLAAEVGGEVQPAFACATVAPPASDVSQRLCYDFGNESDSSNFTNEAGTWSIEDGTYHGLGPQDGQITCPGGPQAGSGMTTSVLTTLSAADVRVHARMTSWTSPDKVLVLRSLASGSRIEVNFRSYWGNHEAGDLVIQSLVGCQQFRYLAPDTIRVPQYPYQAVEVDVQLRGQRLTIAMDGRQLYDDSPIALDGDGGSYGLPTNAGSVGFGVFWDGEAVFDNLVVEVLK